jgi:predicted nucleic acid-binding protein
MTTGSRSTDVCVDTCVFINFAIIARVELIVQLSDFTFHVPQEVAEEVTVDEQRQKLEQMFSLGGLKKAQLQDAGELERFAQYSQTFGKGESACLAIAACRGWIFATDETKDKRLRKEINTSKVRIVNTPGLLLKAIQEGLLSVSEADAIKTELEKNRFKMDFHSFQEFSGGPSTKGST